MDENTVLAKEAALKAALGLAFYSHQRAFAEDLIEAVSVLIDTKIHAATPDILRSAGVVVKTI